jgi:hypothetical protein
MKKDASKGGMWLCPVCGDFFEEATMQGVDCKMAHCLKCNHHYPPDGASCENCRSNRCLVMAIRTTLSESDAIELYEWSKKNGYRRGVYETFLPGGVHERGGLPC